MRYLPSPCFTLKRLPLAIAGIFCGIAATSHAATSVQTVSFEYDAVTGLKTADIREPDNAQLHLRSQYTYNALGNRLTTTVSSNATGAAAITSYQAEKLFWNEDGRAPSAKVNALNQTMSGTFDASNMPTMIQNLNGLKTNYTFDSFRRKVSEVQPDRNKRTWEYFSCVIITSLTPRVDCKHPLAKYRTTVRNYNPGWIDPNITSAENGPWAHTYYDELSRVIRIETVAFDGVSVITQDTEYDALGRVARTSRPYFANAAIQWTSYTYDALGRLLITTTPDNATTKTSYNGLTRVETNQLNQTRTSISNPLGQLIQVIDNQTNSIAYQYDAMGNLTKTTDPKGNVVNMVYDGLGRRTTISDPDMGTNTFVYNALGQVLQQTDAKNNVTNNSYDLLGRMTRRAEADLVSAWTFDACTMGKGQLCSSTADNGYTATWSYDNLARPSQTVNKIDTTYTTGVTYNTNGQIATLSFPGGLVLKHVYGNYGYLSEVRNNATNALLWQANKRDAEGHLLQQTYGNNVVTQQVFEAATGRMKNITAGAANGVQNLSFSYDARGNLFTRTDANQSLNESFLYDTLNRITSNTINASSVGLQTQSYGYDSIGDITSRSDLGAYTYGAVNNHPHAVSEIALAAGGKRQYTYDASGNLTQEVQRDALGNIIAAKGRTIAWSSFNMPTAMSSPSATLNFVYGPEHQRIKQITPTGTVYYVHPDNAGGLSYEKEVKTNGTVEHRQYITAGDGVVAMVKQVGTTTSTVYMHRDHLGSTTATTNDAGAVIERFAYEPFGQRRTPAGATTPGIVGTTTDRGFTNHEHLDELGLIHMNGRVYDPATGRFMSADPNVPYPSNIQSYNRYSYVRNNPGAMTDPTGFLEDSGGCTKQGGNSSGSCSDDSGGAGGGITDVGTVTIVYHRDPLPDDINRFSSPVSDSRGEVDKPTAISSDNATAAPGKRRTIYEPPSKRYGAMPGSVLTAADLKKIWKSLRLPDYAMVSIPTIVPGIGVGFTFDRFGQLYIGLAGGISLPGVSGKSWGVGWIGTPEKPTAEQLDKFLSGWSVNAGFIIGSNWSDPNGDGSGNPDRAGPTIQTPGVSGGFNVKLKDPDFMPLGGLW